MYTAKGQLDLNSTLKQYSPLVRRLAHQMIAKLPANVEIDDLIQVGMIGLTDALSRFDAAQGVQFETFATQRIRGAMLDELRGNDYLSRGTRKQQRSIESAVAQARAEARPRAGRERDRQGDGHHAWPSTRSCSARCAAPSWSTSRTWPAPRATTTSSTATWSTKAANPLAQLQDHRMREALIEAIKVLPEREQYVMSMYYEHDMNLKEIAAVLKVTESRVCQLHSQSIARLRVKLRDF